MAAFRSMYVLVLLFSFQFFLSSCQNVFNLSSMIAKQLRNYQNLGLQNLDRKTNENTIPSGFCKTWVGTVVTENATWEEPHCRRCRCDAVLGAVCQDPPCAIAFHPYLETNCEKWSSDGCCCLRSTCEHNGVHYEANDWFLLTPSDPCTMCKCNPSDGLPNCVEATCPKLPCVDATPVPKECCPLCLTGHNCGLPPLPLPVNDSIKDVTPILESASRLITLTSDSSLAWNCTCLEAGSNANCILVATETDSTTTISEL